MTARGLLGRTATLAVLCLGAALVLVPFVWMISLSLKPAAEIFSPDFTLLPAQIEWRNYVKAFTEVPLHRFLLNGVIVCLGILVFQILWRWTRHRSPCWPACWCPITSPPYHFS